MGVSCASHIGRSREGVARMVGTSSIVEFGAIQWGAALGRLTGGPGEGIGISIVNAKLGAN